MWTTLMRGAFLRLAGGLRFPTLFALTFLLFGFDLLIPDLLPFVDELLLGLVTLILAGLRRETPPESQASPGGGSSSRNP